MCHLWYTTNWEVGRLIFTLYHFHSSTRILGWHRGLCQCLCSRSGRSVLTIHSLDPRLGQLSVKYLKTVLSIRCPFNLLFSMQHHSSVSLTDIHPGSRFSALSQRAVSFLTCSRVGRTQLRACFRHWCRFLHTEKIACHNVNNCREW